MFNTLKKISAATAMLVAIPALASAQTISYGTSPVAVTACNSHESYDATAFSGARSYGVAPIVASNDVAIDYINNGSVPATSVTFVFNAGNRTQNVVANGSFAPGVKIERTLAAGNGGEDRDLTCAVAHVQFADGSVWNAGPREISNR